MIIKNENEKVVHICDTDHSRDASCLLPSLV